MSRSLEQIAADFDNLHAMEFDYANTNARDWERLQELCDEMQTIDKPEACAPVLFRTMERLADTICSPGPIVHTLETWRAIMRFIEESVVRNQRRLVWMINRSKCETADYERLASLLEC